MADVDRRLAAGAEAAGDEPERPPSDTGAIGAAFPRGVVILLGAAAAVVSVAGSTRRPG